MRKAKATKQTDDDRIAPDFKLTGYERQVLSNVVDFVSSVRDPEYAARGWCFIGEYVKTRDLPIGDTVELLTQLADSRQDDHELLPEDLLIKEQRRERNKQRRRAVVDDVLKRAGYVPTDDEVAAYEEFAAETIAEFQEMRRELGWDRELATK